jgi:hypothetical protein
MIQEINNMEDVKTFFHDILKEGINAHPDELFENYVNIETGEQIFTTEEADFRDKLMEKSYSICEEIGIDIYDTMQEIYLKETGLDQFIPLPSQNKFE